MSNEITNLKEFWANMPHFADLTEKATPSFRITLDVTLCFDSESWRKIRGQYDTDTEALNALVKECKFVDRNGLPPFGAKSVVVDSAGLFDCENKLIAMQD